jgi:hypothetical protein
MRFSAFALLCLLFASLADRAAAQSLGNAGTIEGIVTDPSGAVVARAQVTLHNALTGYSQSAETGPDGSFRFSNIPPNPYHLEVKAAGFSVFSQNVDIRNAIPIQLKASLALAGENTTVVVEGAAEALETDPSAHVDVAQNVSRRSRRELKSSNHL